MSNILVWEVRPLISLMLLPGTLKYPDRTEIAASFALFSFAGALTRIINSLSLSFSISSLFELGLTFTDILIRLHENDTALWAYPEFNLLSWFELDFNSTCHQSYEVVDKPSDDSANRIS